MQESKMVTTFSDAARAVGAEVTNVADVDAVVDYVKQLAKGAVMVPDFASAKRLNLTAALKTAGLSLVENDLRQGAATAAVGLTGANFAFAATGTVVLESTAEDSSSAARSGRQGSRSRPILVLILEEGVSIPLAH